MLRGSADRLHRSQSSCQLIQGVINTNPAKGGPGSHRKALSPCNQSSINLPSPCAQRPSPAAGAPHSGCHSPGAGPAGLPHPPFLLGFTRPWPRGPPLPRGLPLQPQCSPALDWDGQGVTGSPVQPWPAPGDTLSPPYISPTHSCPRDRNLHFTTEALRPGMHKPPALGSQLEVMDRGSPLYRLFWELPGSVSAPSCTCTPSSCIKVCIFLPCSTLTCTCPMYRGSAGPPQGVMGSLYGPLLHPLPQFPKG